MCCAWLLHEERLTAKSRHGLTLFELLLVMAVLVVLAAIAYPSLEAMYTGFRVTAAADAVRAAWAQARAHAMNEGRPYRFSVLPNKGNYRVAPDLAGYWAGTGGAPEPTDPSNPPLVLEAAVPKGVRFDIPSAPVQTSRDDGSDTNMPAGSVDPGMWVTAVTFLPDGTARETFLPDGTTAAGDVQLVLHARGSRTLVLKLRCLTGAVTTEWLPAEEGR